MYKSNFYFAILSDGKEKRVANWSNADAMLLVETLRRERGDLLAVVKEACMALIPGQSSGNEVLADVSLVDYHQAPVTPPSESVKHGNPNFRSTLEAGELEQLADMCNELEIFAHPHPVTADHLAAFFRMEPTGLRVNNLRLFSAMLFELKENGFIGRNWQSPIYSYNLLRPRKKEGFVNRSDLTTATYQIHGIKNDNRINFIEKTIQKMYSSRKNSQKH